MGDVSATPSIGYTGITAVKPHGRVASADILGKSNEN